MLEINENTADSKANLNLYALTTTTYSSEEEDNTNNIGDRPKYLKETVVARLYEKNLRLKDKMKIINDMNDVWDLLCHCEISTSNLNKYDRRENIEIAVIPKSIQNQNLEKYVVNIQPKGHWSY